MLEENKLGTACIHTTLVQNNMTSNVCVRSDVSDLDKAPNVKLCEAITRVEFGDKLRVSQG